MTKLSQIPQEIFDLIAKSLGISDTKTAADALLKREGQENKLWTTIFKSDAWVKEAARLRASPALVGPKIGMIGKANYKHNSRHHILLVTNDWGGDLRFSKNLFFESLRDGYRYNEREQKVILPETKLTSPDNQKMITPEIVLYLQDVICAGEPIVLPKSVMKHLFEKKSIRTQYCFANERKIRSLEDGNVYGIGGKISKPCALIPICVMYLFDSGRKWRVVLESSKCPPVTPIMEKNSLDIYGWKYGWNQE